VLCVILVFFEISCSKTTTDLALFKAVVPEILVPAVNLESGDALEAGLDPEDFSFLSDFDSSFFVSFFV